MIKAGGGELITNAFNGDGEGGATLNNPTVEDVIGIYSCSIKTGCKDRYMMMLRDDQTIEFLSSNDPSQEEELKKEDTTGVQADLSTSTEETQEKKVERTSIVFVGEEGQSNETQQGNTATSTQDGGDVAVASSTENGSSSKQTTSEVPTIAENVLGTDEENVPENLTSLSDLENASKAVVEKGTWAFGGGNILIITLTQLGDTEYTEPQKLVIKKIGASTLSNIAYDKTRYKEMVRPVFVKVDK